MNSAMLEDCLQKVACREVSEPLPNTMPSSTKFPGYREPWCEEPASPTSMVFEELPLPPNLTPTMQRPDFASKDSMLDSPLVFTLTSSLHSSPVVHQDENVSEDIV